MNAVTLSKGKWRRRLTWMAGAFMIFLSLVAVVVSLGMPGAGWVLSALVLVAAGLMAPLTGRWCAGMALAISCIHLVTFGPLSGFQLQPGISVAFLVLAIVLPIVLGLLALIVAVKRQN